MERISFRALMRVSIIAGLELNVGVKGVKVTAYQNAAGETVEYEGEGWTSTSIEGSEDEQQIERVSGGRHTFV